MGGDSSKHEDNLTKNEIKQLVQSTNFSKDEIASLHKQFKNGDAGNFRNEIIIS